MNHPVQKARNGRAILDIKGLLMHSYHRTKDVGTPYKTEKGQPAPRYQKAFETFLESYFDQIVEAHDFAPIDMVICWDSGREYREAMYPEYKANREEADPAYQQELDKLYTLCKNFFAAVGCIQVSVEGVEADDVVAWIAPKVQPFCNVYTVDNDLVALASDTVQVFVKDLEKDNYEGIKPQFLTLYKSLVGDTADNIKGVKGIGPVAWDTMVHDFGWDGMAELRDLVEAGVVKDILEMVAEVGTKEIEKVGDNAGQWILSYNLAKLHPELCEGFKRGKKVEPIWFKRVPDERRLISALKPSGLEHLHEKYVTFCPIEYLMEEGDSLDELLEDMGELGAFDYETYDPNPQESLNEVSRGGNFVNVLNQKLTGGSFCFGPNLQYVIYVPVFHKDTYNFPPETISEILQRCPGWIVHNAAFEKTVTDLNLGKDLVSNLCDTQIMSTHVDENRDSHRLKDLSGDLLKYSQITYEEVVGDKGDMSQLTGEEVMQYGCDDSLVTAHLWSLFDLIMMIEGTERFVYENEFYFSDAVGKAFQKGIPTDQKLLKKMEAEDKEKLKGLDQDIRALLRLHCTKVNEDAVRSYMKEITPFLKAKAESQVKEKGGNYDEVFTAALEKAEEKWNRLAVYNEYTETGEIEEFIPTVKKLEKLLSLAGVLEQTGLPTSMAGARITEWLVKLEDAELSEDARNILNTVAECSAHFKTRDPEGMHPLQLIYQQLIVASGNVKTIKDGDDLNTDSPDQMQSLLYLKLGLPVRIRSKVDRGSFRDRWKLDGGPATSDKAIESALAEDAPEGSWERAVLMTLREIKSTLTQFKFYYNPYPKWVYESDGRIHPQIKNCGTVTRRPTGTAPNILQVKKGPIRRLYLPLEINHILISPDFNGQELRITASESRDPVLLDAYTSVPNKDIHSLTACSFAPDLVRRMWPELTEFMDLTPDGKHMLYECFVEWLHVADDDEENQDFRKAASWLRGKRAKATNFTAAYGGGFPALSLNLLIPEEEAKELLEAMFSLYKRLQPWQQEVADLARKQGYVTTVYGTRRHATEDVVSKDGSLRSRMERQLVNFLAQGTAADILKVVAKEMIVTGLLEETHSYLVGPVYDEVLCSVPVPYAHQFCERLQKIMDLTPPGHPIPMVSEFKLGFSWGDMVEIGTDTSWRNVEDGIQRAKKLIEERRAEK